MQSGPRRKARAAKTRAPGQATVELALIFSLLVLLVVGVADVARIYAGHLSVVHAAGVGARWATLTQAQRDQSAYADVRAVVVDDLGNSIPAAQLATMSVVTEQIAVSPSPQVRVTVIYEHAYLFGALQNTSFMVGLPTSFTARATMPGTCSPSICP